MEHARRSIIKELGWLVVSASAVVLAAVVAASLLPTVAQASTAGLEPAATGVLVEQAGGLASADAATIDKTAVKNAKAIVKNAKATSGSTTAKLKKIYAYVATDKKWKGAFAFESYLTFCLKAAKAEKAKYYTSYAGPKTMKGLYKKYAVDAYKLKKASCYHYAALFAVAAKQALGDKATVKIAIGTAKMKNSEGKYYWNSHHSWVEATIGKTTYVYDTQQGNYNSKSVGKKSAFGAYCGSKKAAVKATYKNYKGATYCTVAL